MSDDPHNTAIKVIAHENGEITVDEGRGYPAVCKDCRFSGWLYEQEYKNNDAPTTCLFYSGGADAKDGDRIIFDLKRKDYCWTEEWRTAVARLKKNWSKKFPSCWEKNANGKCSDYVKAKRLSILSPRRWFGLEHRTRKMRK